MLVVVFLFAIIFLALAALTFGNPRLMSKLVNRIEIKWSVDKELFLNSQLVRTFVGGIFLLAAVVLFYASYSISR